MTSKTETREVYSFSLTSALRAGSVDQTDGSAVHQPDEPRVLVTDFFSLVNVTNTGAAFGSFRGNNTFFIAISSVALVVVLGLLLTGAST